MAKLVVLYKRPADVEAFNSYYFSTHLPLAKQMPFVQRFDVSEGPVMTPSGPSDVHLVAVMHFRTLADLHASFASPEGEAAGADLANFAQAGIERYFFETAEQ